MAFEAWVLKIEVTEEEGERIFLKKEKFEVCESGFIRNFDVFVTLGPLAVFRIKNEIEFLPMKVTMEEYLLFYKKANRTNASSMIFLNRVLTRRF